MTTLGSSTGIVRNGGATAKSITLPSSPTLQVGDDMYLQWVGGTDYNNGPAGWALIYHEAPGAVGVSHAVFHRICQAGDPGSTVTVDDTVTTVAKSVLNFVAVRSVDSTGPVAGSNHSNDTSSSVTHNSPSIAGIATTGKVLQFIGMKDGTASSTLSPGAAYTSVIRTSSGGATAPVVGGIAISTADVAAGTVGSQTWTSDQASNNVTMIAIAIKPLSTVVGVRTTTDITVPTGATFVGGADLHSVHGDDDPNTYDRFVLDPTTPQVEEERFPTLPGPLTGYTGKLQLDGAVTVTVTVRLVQGSTVLFTATPITITAAGEQSYHVDFDSTVQAAQTDLTNIRIRKSYVGS
jgi:hypothetical protein